MGVSDGILNPDRRAGHESWGHGMGLDASNQPRDAWPGTLKTHHAATAQVAACGAQVEYHGADVSKPGDIAAMMTFAADRFGGIDILVNNAGIQSVANVENFPIECWDAVIAINLSAAFHTSRLALPHMKTRRWVG
jgi:3-hydroxybutyrate dehydrogenase